MIDYNQKQKPVTNWESNIRDLIINLAAFTVTGCKPAPISYRTEKRIAIVNMKLF
jgi:hypothetical protein